MRFGGRHAARRWVVLLGAAASLSLAACSERAAERPAEPSVAAVPVALEFAGSAACERCHAEESRRYRGSHHALSMQPATKASVLGDLASLPQAPPEVRYTFGVYPLQQYLVPGARGRLHVYGLAWDSRARDAGGQRWFDPAAGSASTTTPHARSGGANAWNSQCAVCHSTGLRKGYDAGADSYQTTWAELNVGCEACHGRGSRHVAWAARDANASTLAHAGFETPLRGASANRWTFAAGQPIARASGARGASTLDRSAEVNRCLPCHARRLELTPEPQVGGVPLDDYAPNLLERGLYHVDGQLDDENFEYASFAQSRMFLAGVTCSNCHDPHSATLVARGNSLCTQCHSAAVYDAERHHHHATQSAGAQCVQCHMPSQTFMAIHVRRDHAIRIPRPDLTLTHGVPNACDRCHTERGAAWAAQTLVAWGVRPGEHDAAYAHGIDAGRRGSADANAHLAALARREDLAPIQRASAIGLLRGTLQPSEREAFERAARDPEPLVRLGAARALDALDENERVALGGSLLGDATRAVRIEAARALADASPTRLSPALRERAVKSLREWLAAKQSTSERPETHVDVGQLYLRLGRADDAKRELDRALQLDPQNLAARVNVADLMRATGRESEAESVLRETVRVRPDAAVAWHALGLALVRQQRRAEAIEALEKAHQLAPLERDYAYVFAIALREAGRVAEARDVLKRAAVGLTPTKAP